MYDTQRLLSLTATLIVVISLATPLPAAAQDKAPGSHIPYREAQALLAHHNQERVAVGTPRLNWSAQLASFAQRWAQQLAQSGCQMQHRQNSPYGENIYMGTAQTYRSIDASIAWANEKRYYRGGPLNESNWYRSGHYTQMVWRDTQYIGCGEAYCGSYRMVVCNYSPAGNVIGQSPYRRPH